MRGSLLPPACPQRCREPKPAPTPILLAQLKSFHNELLAQLEQKVELDARYLSVSAARSAAAPPRLCQPLAPRGTPALRRRVSSLPRASRPAGPLAPVFVPV